MAIGLAQLFGITLPENFDRPYLARSLREFWQRWHMTLTSWLRDYLYIPLGGNRRRPLRAAANVLVTMVLGGLWHGANWTFLAWGLWHGVWLLIERGVEKVTNGRMPRLLGTVGMLVVVALGWVFFRANSISEAGRVLLGMMQFSGIAPHDLTTLAAVLGLFACLLLVEGFRLRERALRLHPAVLGLLAGALAAAVYFASAVGTEFIYWRF
jgi:alginate O-acetyltransferase complex protein AlgI